jgi:hypothetical protein
MSGCFHVKGVGKGGGLALYWQEGITVDLLSFSRRHIDVHVSGGPYDCMWRGTFVYGEPKPQDRHLMWTLMHDLKPLSSEPWLMMGDFNEAMWQEEHFSMTKRSERLMADFRDALSHCDLHDMGFVGAPWTFDNKQKGARNVRVRLDRAVASPAWSSRFPDFRLRHLTSPRSDHCPLLIEAERIPSCRIGRPIRRYEIAWEREPSLPAAVEEAWSRRVACNDLGDVNATLREVMNSLYGWKNKFFKSVPKELDRLRKAVEETSQKSDPASIEERQRLLHEMDEMLYREEIQWMQRSRVAWLREGDRNTKFFPPQSFWSA